MKSIDLFAGAGGLSCGLSMAGFTPILANELIEAHANTYQVNNENTAVVIGDVRQVCKSNLKQHLGLKEGQLDLLAGGPPCQGFSVNAPIRNLNDERNHLFKDFLKVASELLPKTILIENVPGIISLGKGTVVQQIYKELDNLGYSVNHKILFAGHYGVPQSRYRTIIIAVKGKTPISFPEPVYNSTSVANFAGASELCISIPPLFAQELLPQTTVHDAISDLPKIENGSKNPPMKYLKKAQSDYQKALRVASTLVHTSSLYKAHTNCCKSRH